MVLVAGEPPEKPPSEQVPAAHEYEIVSVDGLVASYTLTLTAKAPATGATDAAAHRPSAHPARATDTLSTSERVI